MMDLDLIYNFAEEILEKDTSGHDWLHALRVEKNALDISPPILSKSQLELIQAACWLHDTIDPKVSTLLTTNIADIENLLKKSKASNEESKEIIYIIQNLSYSKNLQEKRELSFLGQIVQDADRLDAIGAIGIARAFYYGGSKKHVLYSDQKSRKVEEITEENYREQTSILNHFYEKLFHLEQSMNTEEAKKMARKRTNFMKVFLDHFYEEINIKKSFF